METANVKTSLSDHKPSQKSRSCYSCDEGISQDVWDVIKAPVGLSCSLARKHNKTFNLFSCTHSLPKSPLSSDFIKKFETLSALNKTVHVAVDVLR